MLLVCQVDLELWGLQVVRVQGDLLVHVGLWGILVRLVQQVKRDSPVHLDCRDWEGSTVSQDSMDCQVSQVHQGPWVTQVTWACRARTEHQVQQGGQVCQDCLEPPVPRVVQVLLELLAYREQMANQEV